jgi:hypothetical protein
MSGDEAENFIGFIVDFQSHFKLMFRSLSAGSRKKLVQYCDLNGKRLAKKYCEIFDDENKRSLATIKAVHPR